MKLYNINNPRFYLLFCILLGVIYVLNAWSPSSYSLALNSIGVDVKPDFGIAREIRSDEWVVQTPLTQALVNNGFERVNSTSIYKEDLRINYGLPIFDWGLFFKPTQWGYVFLPAPYAFSLYYYLLFAFFLIGYQKLIKVMGVDDFSAFLLSLTFYFTGTVQFWWTVNAATFSFFPWVLYSLYKMKSSPIYALSFFWFLVCWQVGNLYPPFTYSLLLVAILWVWMFIDLRTVRLHQAILAVVAGIGALVVVCFYFYDYFQIMKSTVYPGERSVPGGGVMSLPMLESLFFPSLWFDSNYNLTAWRDISNICQISTWATIIPVMVIFYIDYKKIQFSFSFDFIRKYIVPGFCLFILLAWTMLPIPAYVGKFLLLDKIPAVRLMLGLGLAVNILAIAVMAKNPMKINTMRIIVSTTFYILSFIAFKGSLSAALIEIITLSIGGLAMWFIYKYWQRECLAISAMAVIYAIGVFFSFNPLMDSKFIFNKTYHTATTDMFDQQVKDYGVVVAAVAGSIVNGLGYPSGNHVLTTPQLDFWYKKFPDIKKYQIDAIFNRYAHIHLIPDSNIIEVSSADVISVPQRCFLVGIDTPCTNVMIKK